MLLSLLFSQPLLFAALILGIIVALSVHEFSHALMANWLGDRTAERMGRLTLNPLAHLDPVGFLMLLIAGFGYARPVPYNPASLKNPRVGSVLVGMAGPASNVIKAVYPSLGEENLLVQFLFFAAIINVNLAVFNLIPIPPLDGSKALLAVFSAPQYARFRYALETQGPFILIMLILVDSFSGVGIFSALFQTLGHGFFRLLGIEI